ncbi:MAG: helix-turn-helix domain-containing protein [Acutalibacteraceae bacterium]|nr:helix-turn-helix domain-containing protein [Acutalibacteraceae bacterium]MEE3311607.1 helix-turn-helix domain-containing protein [Acutalibacteraceae bacterium]
MTFSDRLTTQRKRKGVSQKQAAADLGISQALLSHYENGIREPGLSFLVKAADYYNVSCDYLLGHAANVLQLNQAVDFEDLPEDAQLSRETFLRAELAIMNSIVEDEEMMDTLNKASALAGYMGLFAAVTKGLLPRSWLGGNSDNKAQFKFLMYTLAGDVHDLTSAPEEEELIGTEAPLCVQTLCMYVNDLINTRVARLM